MGVPSRCHAKGLLYSLSFLALQAQDNILLTGKVSEFQAAFAAVDSEGTGVVPALIFPCSAWAADRAHLQVVCGC